MINYHTLPPEAKQLAWDCIEASGLNRAELKVRELEVNKTPDNKEDDRVQEDL